MKNWILSLSQVVLTLLLMLFSVGAPPAVAHDPLAEMEREILESAGAHHEFSPNPHSHPAPHLHTQESHALDAFRYPFMQRALLAGVLAGASCAWLGVFVVLRRMVFVGVALAQMASCGVAFGVFYDLDPLICAVLVSLTSSLVLGMAQIRGPLTPSARIGLAYLIGGSLAILMLSKSGTGEAEQLEMIQGSLLTVGGHSIQRLIGLALTVLIVHVVGFKKLLGISFDPLYAALIGVNVWLWNLILFTLLGVGVSLTIQSCGLVLFFGYLILPAATGLASGCRTPGVVVIAQCSQALATVLGLWVAFEFDLPGGPTIVLVLVLLLLIMLTLVALLKRIRWSATD